MTIALIFTYQDKLNTVRSLRNRIFKKNANSVWDAVVKTAEYEREGITKGADFNIVACCNTATTQFRSYLLVYSIGPGRPTNC